MNNIQCIFCHIEGGGIVIEENGCQCKKCPECGLVYVTPQPSFDEVVDLYGHDDAHISAEDHIAGDFSKRLYARHHLKLIRPWIKKGSLLEIGAGAGYFLDEARKDGFTPYGLEFNPAQARFIREELDIPCEESPLNASMFTGKRFDLVYHCDVISHFFDPFLDLKKTNEVMSKGGFLVFETGNLGDVDEKYFKYFERFQLPDHLFFFSEENLIELLEKTGFDVVKIHRYSIMPQLKVMKILSGMKDKVKNSTTENNGQKKLKHSTKSPQSKRESWLKAGIKNAYHYFNYMLRYKVGRIVPKKNQPQTLIVIARKKS